MAQLDPVQPIRIQQLVRDLQALAERLSQSDAPTRKQTYTRCLTLLEELGALGRQQADGRELNALTREAGWHIRSLAAPGGGQPAGEAARHAAWAQESLARIARQVVVPVRRRG